MGDPASEGARRWARDLEDELRVLERRVASLLDAVGGLERSDAVTRLVGLRTDVERAIDGLVLGSAEESEAALRRRASDAGPSPGAPVPLEDRPSDLRPHRVLVVDDDDDVRHLLSLQLQLLDLDVIEATDVGTAIERCIADDGIDGVLCDVHMPGEDGYRFLSELHGIPGHERTPVVLLTSDRSAEAVARGLEAGAADFIRKPVVHRELAARLRRVLVDAEDRRAVADTLFELATLAETDALTGVPNRRAADQALEQGAAATGADERLGLLMIDVDDFKEVNDRAGHAAGDRILRSTAQALLASKRPGDVVARWGGDEFAFLAPGADEDALATISQRILTSVHDIRRPGGHQTVSIGLASGTGPQLSAADLVERADAALYRAKQSGRDRFERG